VRAATVLLAALALLQPLLLTAQEFDGPVRRALPVNPAQPDATPSASEPPTPPAVPFDFDQAPIPRARPAASVPVFRPAPSSTPEPSPVPPSPDDIRVAPNVGLSPDKAQINLANGFYARKQYELAAPEYERYLGTYDLAPDRETALFRLGECYKKMGNLNSAKNSYATLLGSFTEGDFVGPAAYRLADLFFQEKDYDQALPFFRQASVREKDPAVANAAQFYEARCLENLHHEEEARDVYENLIEVKENNPFRDVSRFSLAQLLLDSGQKSEALEQLQAIVKETSQAAAKAEALVKAA